MKTLLLDDNLLSQTRVEAQLKSAGCEVNTRRVIPEAGEFELVVVNLGSRSIDGIKLIETAKSLFPEALLWAFCGHLEVERRRAALALGVDRLLTNENAMSALADELRRFYETK